jgi:transcriptional regulator with XRE-family HTH domain
MSHKTGEAGKQPMTIDKDKEKDRRTALEFGNRIKAVRKKLKMKQKDFAERIGMKNNYLCEIESGHIKPGFDFFYKIMAELKLNPVYLLHGKGDMFLPDVKEGGVSGVNGEKANEREGSPLLNDPVYREMLWYMEQSNLIRYSVLEFFTRYKMHNLEDISSELKGKNKQVPDIF